MRLGLQPLLFKQAFCSQNLRLLFPFRPCDFCLPFTLCLEHFCFFLCFCFDHFLVCDCLCRYKLCSTN
ncbi:hypothetical protein BAL199_17538 [alpha proteobacterium BAL199]|nr:hypothetical protein BAL199_17538 [alpha proteobacterium BAL199]